MVCVNCGKHIESGAYVCEFCVNEAHIRQHFAESLVVYPSILNDLDFSDSMILSIDSENSLESLKIYGDDINDQHIPKTIQYQISELTDKSAKKLYKNYLKILTNCGLPYDLEEKPLSVLTKGDLSLAQLVLLGVSEIERKLPNYSDEKLHLLLGNLHYSLSRVTSGAITVTERNYHLESAKGYYDKVLSINQYSISAWKNKARVLIDLGNNEEAISCFNWILNNLKLPENDLTVVLNKGLALFNMF